MDCVRTGDRRTDAAPQDALGPASANGSLQATAGRISCAQPALIFPARKRWPATSTLGFWQRALLLILHGSVLCAFRSGSSAVLGVLPHHESQWQFLLHLPCRQQ